MKFRPSFGFILILSALGILESACGSSAKTAEQGTEVTDEEISRWPTLLELPNGFQPEGIAIGKAPTAYFGSLLDGSIYRIDLRTGTGSVLSIGPGTPSVGLKLDLQERLFVAGGSSGSARVIDTRNGTLLRSYKFTTENSFVNDVILTKDAAWFTDSVAPALYKVPLEGGAGLPAENEAVRLPLTGDLVYGEGTNVNGITTSPDGASLIVVTTTAGKLYRVDPSNGVTRTVDLGGEVLTDGDGLLREGRTLYVVRNQASEIAVVELTDDASSGKVVSRITDARFDVPPTVAAFGRRLYLPNARFTTTPTPTTTYNVVSVDKP